MIPRCRAAPAPNAGLGPQPNSGVGPWKEALLRPTTTWPVLRVAAPNSHRVPAVAPVGEAPFNAVFCAWPQFVRKSLFSRLTLSAISLQLSAKPVKKLTVKLRAER